MPKTTPSQRTKELHKSLRPKVGYIRVEPHKDIKHRFSVITKDWNVEQDEVRMDPEDFPYIRAALIDEAASRGDIQKGDKRLPHNKKITIKSQ